MAAVRPHMWPSWLPTEKLKIFSRMGGSYEAVKRLTLPHKFPNLYMAILVAVCVCVCVCVCVGCGPWGLLQSLWVYFQMGCPDQLCASYARCICRSGLVSSASSFVSVGHTRRAPARHGCGLILVSKSKKISRDPNRKRGLQADLVQL